MKTNYDYMFDIRPRTNELRVTLRLAERMFEQGHTVYYNYFENPMFSGRLRNRGIIRVKYPWNLWLSKPDLVLLDPVLSNRADVYRQSGCTVAYIAVQRKRTEPLSDEADGALWLHLPPSPCRPFAHSMRQQAFIGEIKKIKEQRNGTVIIGVAGEGMLSYYRILADCARQCSDFRFILSTGEQPTEENWFTWPENFSVYRQQELQPLLPWCDLVLTDETDATWMDCIYFRVPTWQLSANEREQLTPSHLEHRVRTLLAEYPRLVEQQNQWKLFYREQNRQLDTLIDRLGDYIKQHQQKRI